MILEFLSLALRENNLMCGRQDFYETRKTCRKTNKLLLIKMKRKDFFSTKSLEKAIHRRLNNTSEEPVNWPRIC